MLPASRSRPGVFSAVQALGNLVEPRYVDACTGAGTRPASKILCLYSELIVFTETSHVGHLMKVHIEVNS